MEAIVSAARVQQLESRYLHGASRLALLVSLAFGLYLCRRFLRGTFEGFVVTALGQLCQQCIRGVGKLTSFLSGGAFFFRETPSQLSAKEDPPPEAVVIYVNAGLGVAIHHDHSRVAVGEDRLQDVFAGDGDEMKLNRLDDITAGRKLKLRLAALGIQTAVSLAAVFQEFAYQNSSLILQGEN